MNKIIAALSILALTATTGSFSINNTKTKTNIMQMQNLKKQQIKNDISLINLNKKGKFYFFNNTIGLVINENKLWFLENNQNFQEIANPEKIIFTEFINGQGGNYGLLTAKDTGKLYLLTSNGQLTPLKIKILSKEIKIFGKVTAISNTKFLVQTQILDESLIFLGEVKDQTLTSLKYISWFHKLKEIQYIRDDEVIIKTKYADYSILIRNSEYTINKLSWKGKYFFKTNSEIWMISNDNNQVLIYNYVTNTYKQLNIYGTDIIMLNSKLYIVKQDNNNIIIINSTGVIVKEKYNFAIPEKFNMLNVNSKLLLLFDEQQNMIKIITRNLNADNELVVIKTINLSHETKSISLLNSQENKKDSSTILFVETLNNLNYILDINVNMQNIENLEINMKNIPDGMNGEMNRYNKKTSIFTQYKSDSLYWYQVF